MTQPFPKHYNIAWEGDIYTSWVDHGYFHPETVANYRQKHEWMNRDESYTIMLPPPNVTGKLHIGHAMMVAVEDVMVRYARMNGYRTLWLPGTDHAAIATQSVVAKRLESDGIDRFDLGRDHFLDKVRDFVAEHRWHITGQLSSLGASLDREREQYTLAEWPARAVRYAFQKLHKKGKIYQDNYVVNRSSAAQSVVSNEEVEHREEVWKLYHINYFVEWKKHFLPIATTRPETMFADVAIAVHPQDKRYKKYIGRNALIPYINKPIPIIADEYVDVSFGTGALKITPTHDPNDFEVAKRHNLSMDQFAFDENNVFTDTAGELFAGKKVDDFTENVIEYLKDIGNLDHIEEHTHTVPYCERTGCRIEPRLSTQWFMDVEHAADKCLHRLDEWDVTIYPDRYEATARKQYLEQIRPWAISRQIWRWHRIPVRTSESGEVFVLSEDDVLRRWKETKQSNPIVAMMIANLVADQRLHEVWWLDDLIDVLFGPSLTPQKGSVIEQYLAMYRTKFANDKELLPYVVAISDLFAQWQESDEVVEDLANQVLQWLEEAIGIVRLPKQRYSYDWSVIAGVEETLIQSSDTLDTWFSSALWPFSTLGWPETTIDVKDFYPGSVLETGYDIIFFRVIRMMMMGAELTWEVPFESVYLHGLVRDEKGRKMSKSIGNVVNPLDIIGEYGADALRLSLLSTSTVGMDKNYSEQDTKYYSRFVNKLRNASRFTTVLGTPDDPGIAAVWNDLEQLEQLMLDRVDLMHDFDLWILHVVNDLIYEADKMMSKFTLGELAHRLVTTVWQYYCDWYIEITKIMPSDLSLVVLRVSLAKLLQLLHPFVPYVTTQLWRHLGFQTELMLNPWPIKYDLPDKNYKINLLMDIITTYRTLRTKVTDKSHEKVNVFLQAGTDMIDYMKQNESLVMKLVGVDSVEYVRDGADVPDHYVTDVVVNITLGVQGIETISKADQIGRLEAELKEEEQFAQTLRKTLSNSGFIGSAPADVVAAKKQKMDEVKARIDTITMELRRLKK